MKSGKFILDTGSFIDRYHNALFLILLLLLIGGEIYLYKKILENRAGREEYIRVIKSFDEKIEEINKELRLNNKERRENMAMIRMLEKNLKLCENKKSS